MNDFTPAKNEYVADLSLDIYKENDTSYLAQYYQIDGPMVLEITYFDKKLIIRHGKTCWYNKNGKLDSIANYFKGNIIGTKEYYDDSLRLMNGKHNVSGSLVYVDSLQIRNKKFFHIADGDMVGKDNFISISKNIDDTSNQPMNQSGQIESTFRGGIKSWMKYISMNLRVPSRLEYLLSEKGGGSRTVEVRFSIDTLGRTCDIVLLKSVETNADYEAMNIIRNSPRWHPASENGRPVKSNIVQQFIFRVKVADNTRLSPSHVPLLFNRF